MVVWITFLIQQNVTPKQRHIHLHDVVTYFIEVINNTWWGRITSRSRDRSRVRLRVEVGVGVGVT